MEKTDGTRTVSLGSVRQPYPKSQEKVDLGSGRAQGKNLGLGQDNRVVLSPRCNRRSHLAGLGPADPTHLKASGMEIWPSQGPFLRPFGF